VLQVLLDGTSLSERVRWVARVTAPAAANLLSAGFFGVAFVPQFVALLRAGAASLSIAVVVTGVGLVRSPNPAAATSRSLASVAAALSLVVAGSAFAQDEDQSHVTF